MMQNYNLLDTPLIRVDYRDGTETADLPQILAWSWAGEDLEFLRLQSHQYQAWYSFLVQLTAQALFRRGDSESRVTSEEFSSLLIDLAGEGGSDAWTLVVGDLSRPAFFQSPVPEGSLESFKNPTTVPDDIDVLITSKNHAPKSSRIRNPALEDWIFALVTCQTMSGYLGRGNYGIARMNGGSSSRPHVAFTKGVRWEDRFRTDVLTWLQVRPTLLEDYAYKSNGLNLLWTVSWNGSDQHPLWDCDPLFIEISRRIRLGQDSDGSLCAYTKPSQNSFLESKAATGNTGDIWTPIKLPDRKALTVPPDGFHHGLIKDLIFRESGVFHLNPALKAERLTGNEAVFFAEVLARAEGKTRGYHLRVIAIPHSVRRAFQVPDERERLANLAKHQIDKAKAARQKVLHPALCALLQGGSDEKLNLRDDRTGPWLKTLNDRVDQEFFSFLWQAVDVTQETFKQIWQSRLKELADEQLDAAILAAPVPMARSLKAVAKAKATFFRSARKNLPAAFSKGDQSEPRRTESK